MNLHLIKPFALLVFLVLGAKPAMADDRGFLQLNVVHGHVTAEAQAVSLLDVLQALAREAPFELTHFSPLAAPVELSVHDLPLDQLLKRLLKRHSYVYQSAQTEDSSVVVHLFVFDDGAGRAPPRVVSTPDAENAPEAPSPPDSIAAANRLIELELAYTRTYSEGVPKLATSLREDPDAAVRARALNILVDLGGDDAFDAIVEGISDRSPTIRGQAIEALVALDRSRAYPSVGRVLFGDPDVDLRLKALRLLGESRDEAAMALIRAGASDWSPEVKKLAAEMLQ